MPDVTFDFETKTKPQFDVLADILYQAIAKKNLLMTKSVDLKSWSRKFEQLNRKDRVEIKEIENVLTWYVQHIGEPFVPRCLSATSFRKLFRDLKKHSALVLTDVTLDPTLVDMYDALSAKRWNPKIALQLKAGLQASFENRKRIVKCLKCYKVAINKREKNLVNGDRIKINPMNATLLSLLGAYTSGNMLCLQNWFLKLHKYFGVWYNGDLQKYIISIESDHWIESQIAICVEIFGQRKGPVLWNSVFPLIKSGLREMEEKGVGEIWYSFQDVYYRDYAGITKNLK